MLSDVAEPQSLRGQWRGSYAIYSPSGATDPALCTYRIEVRRQRDGCDGEWDNYDYGFDSRWRSSLSAATSDGTDRMVAVSTDDDDPFTPPDPETALVLTWLFPESEVRLLEAGAYVGRIFASLGAETAELQSFTVVFR